MTLFEAVARQDPAALSGELARGADPNLLGEGRRTPLIDAAGAGWLEGVKLLLAGGAEPGWKDELGETALLRAAANGHRDVARMLAPLATDDERDLARAFLGAVGASLDPEFHYDESRLKTAAAGLAARAAELVGHDEPAQRMDRIRRARDGRKK